MRGGLTQTVGLCHTHTHSESRNTSDFRLARETVGGGMGVTLQSMEESKMNTPTTTEGRRLDLSTHSGRE